MTTPCPAMLRCGLLRRGAAALAVTLSLVAMSNAAGQSPTGGPEDVERLLARDDVSAALTLIRARLARNPGDGVLLYLLARGSARSGDVDQAERALLNAVKSGFHDFSAMRRQRDLDRLRSGGVLPAILAARDAADGLLAERRLADWIQHRASATHQSTTDPTRGLDWLLPPELAFDHPAIARAHTLFDHLAQDLFTPLHDSRVTLLVIDDDAGERAEAGHHHLGGYDHARRELVVEEVARALPHELVHVLHHRSMDALGQDHPFWLQEGLACLFESATIDTRGDELVIALTERDLIAQQLVARGAARPWREFMRSSRRVFLAEPASNYAQARSMMRFLHQHAGVRAVYQAIAASAEEDASGILGIEREMAATIDSVDAAWQRWVLEEKIVLDPRTMQLVRVADLIDEGRLATSESAPRPPTSTSEHVDRALEVEGRYRALRPTELAEYPRAIAGLRAVIELDPQHAAARYDLALALIAIGEPEAAGAQRDLLRELDGNLASLLDSLLRR